MGNTHILSKAFEYVEPKTVEEVLRFLDQHGDKAKIIAGGTDLLVEMKKDGLHPDYLINIARVPSLRFLISERGLRIGTLTPFRELEKSRGVQERYTALYEAAESISSVQIKNMGTIGGNLCHASPAADSAPPLIAFKAKIKIVKGEREKVVPLEEFFIGPGKTILAPEELLLEIQVPEWTGKVGSSFIKMARVSADLAKASVAVVVDREGNVCRDIRITVGAVAPRPLRVKKAEEALISKRFEDGIVERASLQASREIWPVDDIRSTIWYRREITKVLVRDAIYLAWKRAGSQG